MSQAPLYLVGGTGLFRRGLASFLEDSPFSVTAEFDSYELCIEAKAVPEAIIFIASGDPADSSKAVQALLDAFTDSRVLVLSAELSVDELGACLKVGASGYVLNSVSKDVLNHSLRLILLGETVFPSQLAAAWATGQLSNADRGNIRALDTLTQRENEILACLTEGSSNKVIARQLGITEATVKIHMKSLVRKLGVQNRTQAALWALNAGVRTATPDLAA